jgi:hypothetical protein
LKTPFPSTVFTTSGVSPISAFPLVVPISRKPEVKEELTFNIEMFYGIFKGQDPLAPLPNVYLPLPRIYLPLRSSRRTSP